VSILPNEVEKVIGVPIVTPAGNVALAVIVVPDEPEIIMLVPAALV
jgi:hypothetical protein